MVDHMAIDAEWRRVAMESMRDGLLLFDADGVVVEMNQAFIDLMGYGMEDAPLRPPYPWWPTAEEDAEALREIQTSFEDVLNGRTPETEFAFYNRERAKVWVQSSGAVIHHAARGVTHLRVVRDITRQRVAQERRAAAADVSHRFATTEDLDDLIGTAEYGFGLLFDGDCTIQLGEGDEQRSFNSRLPHSHAPLPPPVELGLAGKPNPDTKALRAGILLVPQTSSVTCRAWVQFPRVRRITVDEMIAADLLAAAFAAGFERLTTEVEASDRLGNLMVAVESHRVVGQATGILVERHHILPNEAFDRLRRASQHRNIKVRELAEWVIESGLDPEGPGSA